jgi:hypothetical protein
MRMLFVSCILVLLVRLAASAQDKPDFSGDWILATPSAPLNAAQALTVRQSFKRESVRGTPVDPPLITLSVERRFNGAVQSDHYTIGTLGGTVEGAVGNAAAAFGGQSEEMRFSTTWDDDRLLIEIRYSGRPVDAGAYSEHKEAWSLDARGALLVTVTDHVPGTEPTTANVIYQRRR